MRSAGGQDGLYGVITGGTRDGQRLGKLYKVTRALTSFSPFHEGKASVLTSQIDSLNNWHLGKSTI